MTEKKAIQSGDRVRITTDGQELGGVVVRFRSWEWILVKAEDDRYYLEVVFNLSAVSWDRIILLQKTPDLDLIDEVARKIAYHPKRLNVADVEGADKLLPASARMVWCADKQ
ncbi:hypothetical protein KBY28_21365 [Ruegeria pomeroyi]|uniref:hypothetical protein n=1 Tax=Ruegeria pomeroyi TaxID=89184 RepID=UPI001F354E3F|nr:hypothetical protein [Ruegeria pomeroyi]MCE8511003.1 hypothetical protein [Ruegeria pomeroyi]